MFRLMFPIYIPFGLLFPLPFSALFSPWLGCRKETQTPFPI